jgi:hypothetical protein
MTSTRSFEYVTAVAIIALGAGGAMAAASNQSSVAPGDTLTATTL